MRYGNEYLYFIRAAAHSFKEKISFLDKEYPL